MCLNPSKISDVGFVACRECWQCRETKVDDWVGRCIAESKTATASHVVTLTYGQDDKTGDTDHIRAAVLTYSDIQKYIKYLRVDGFPLRYFAVGEYGSIKGRAHWHILLFWDRNVPEHKLKENFLEKHWPHGWSYWDKCTPEAIRYACKYLLKDPADPEKQGWGPMVSKKPPLGHEYFLQLAEKYVEQGLSPQSLKYSFPEVRRVPYGFRGKSVKQFNEAKKPVQFMMHGKTAENFLNHFIKTWRERHNDEPPRSAVVWKYDDKLLKQYFDSVPKPLSQRKKGTTPSVLPFEGAVIRFSEKHNCYYTSVNDVRYWFSQDQEGDLSWAENISPKKHKHPIQEMINTGILQATGLAEDE